MMDRNEYKLSMDDVLSVTGSVMGLTLDEIRSQTRRKDLVDARCIAAKFGKDVLKLSNKQIALSLGKTDHSTIVHARKRWAGLHGRDDAFAISHAEIASRLVARCMARTLDASTDIDRSQPV